MGSTNISIILAEAHLEGCYRKKAHNRKKSTQKLHQRKHQATSRYTSSKPKTVAMANPQCTAVQKAPASSAVEPKHGKVSPSCVKPLKSCLKKVSSYSDVKEASAALVVEIPTMPRPSSGCALMLSKNNKKSKISPKRVGRRDRIKMREAFSATDSNGNDTAPKRALRRCSTEIGRAHV